MIRSRVKRENIRFAVLAIDVACFRLIAGKLCVLLGKADAKSFFKNRWGLIGGMIEPQETAEAAVERHLREKAGIADIYKEQLYSFSRVNRDPRGRVVSVTYLALANRNPQDLKGGETETRWMPVSEAAGLAYDHDEVLKVAVERLRSRIGYTNLIQHLLPKIFTLTEFQDAYEIILNKKMDKRNFRKKVLAIGMIKPTGSFRRGEPMRPAKLYKFASSAVSIIEII